MIIRKARDQEYDMIKKQRLSSYEIYSEVIPDGHWEVLKTTLTSENVKEAGAEIYVSEIDGRIAGSVVLFPSKSKAYEWDSETLEYPEIRMLAVDAGFRSKGIGKALVQHCISKAKKDGYSFVGLHTANFMENAMRLYESLGFSRVPSLDFEPLDDGIVVKAFRLDLND